MCRMTIKLLSLVLQTFIRVMSLVTSDLFQSKFLPYRVVVFKRESDATERNLNEMKQEA